MNKVILIGRLTKDPELRYTQSNIACVTVDVAINNGKDKDGNERKVDFIRIIVWDKQAENMAKYTHKGSLIAIDGSIKTDSYENDQGEKKYRTYVLANRIMFLDSKKTEEPLPKEPDYLQNQSQNDIQALQSDPYSDMGRQVSMEDYPEINEDDLPF